MVAIRTIITVVLLSCALVYGGWYGHGVYYGYKENQAKEVQQIVDNGMKGIEQTNANQLEQFKRDFSNLKTKTIERQIPYIVKDKLYSVTCSNSEGIDTLEVYKQESNVLRTSTKEITK